MFIEIAFCRLQSENNRRFCVQIASAHAARSHSGMPFSFSMWLNIFGIAAVHFQLMNAFLFIRDGIWSWPNSIIANLCCVFMRLNLVAREEIEWRRQNEMGKKALPSKWIFFFALYFSEEWNCNCHWGIDKTSRTVCVVIGTHEMRWDRRKRLKQ